jgi:hypothetical protein
MNLLYDMLIELVMFIIEYDSYIEYLVIFLNNNN